MLSQFYFLISPACSKCNTVLVPCSSLQHSFPQSGEEQEQAATWKLNILNRKCYQRGKSRLITPRDLQVESLLWLKIKHLSVCCSIHCIVFSQYSLFNLWGSCTNSWRHNLWHPLVFCQFLSPGCINFKSLSNHQQEEVLRIPKHPQLAKFRWFLVKLKENKSFPK